jgi:dipeptidyl aminopeptidase/acylaminoacyl peptidase
LRPAEIAAIELHPNSAPRQVSHLNDDLLKEINFGDIEDIGFSSRDGAQIQGWLYKPFGLDPHKKYPLILAVHGGPVYMGDTRFNIRCQLYASFGYLVLYVNPRSDNGYGTKWTNTVSFNMPGLDYEDLMAGVGYVQSRGYVDQERLFITGKSYGGTLTAWAVGHTKKFAAAAILSPNADWISWSATSDLPLSASGFFFRKPFWEDPSEWLAHSPVMYFGNVTTPTLIMNGESDLRTPIGQSEELFVALKTRGVPTLLVRFPNDSHLDLPPSHVMREILYPIAWFGRYGGKANSNGNHLTR